MVDISPKTLPAIRNGGFLKNTSDRILDPLFARTLVLSSGKETIAIVIVDSCMFPTSLCDEIKRMANRETGIPVNRILISATHTHSAPSAMMCLGCPPDDPYIKFVPSKVAQSIVKAHASLVPAKVGWTVVDGSEFTNCRRWITRSDRIGVDPFGQRTVRAMMHPGYQNPNYTSPAGPIDPWLSVLSVVSAKDNSPICVMANLSMHYFGGGAFSADYFGEVAQILERKLGGSGEAKNNFVGIMSQGTSGDLHWMDYSQPRSGTTRKQYANQVADRVIKAWKKIKHDENLTIEMAETRLTIDRRTPSKGRREWARPINVARQGRVAKNQVEVYAEQAEWIHQNPKTEVVLQALRIGKLGITAIPNEVYGITGLKLKRQSPLAQTINLELANGATGYIPPPEQHRLGGYTTWPARTAGLEEKAEPLIVSTLLKLLEKVSGKERKQLETFSTPYSNAVNSLRPMAYWRMDDMDSAFVRDCMGQTHGKYRGGVALFLPGPTEKAFAADPKSGTNDQVDFLAHYSNRSVYLAGGHIAIDTSGKDKKKGLNDFSLTMWFQNFLPTAAREQPTVLVSTENGTLSIAGKRSGMDAGRLEYRIGERVYVGTTPVAIKHWQQLAMTKEKNQLHVFLDGNSKPEITVTLSKKKPFRQLLIGSDGKSNSTFDGKVDEIALYDRTLPIIDVVALHQESGISSPPKPKPIVFLGPKPTDQESRSRYAKSVMSSKPIAFLRLHDSSDTVAADKAKRLAARYESGSEPLKWNSTKQNFSGGRVKTSTAKLGNTYSVELWFRNELPVDSRPVTAYLFSRAVDGVEGAMGDNLGIGGTHSNMGKLIVFNGNERNQLLGGQTSIPAGSWAHVVLVRENQKVTVYLNGDIDPEIQGSLPIGYPANCKDLLIGGRADNFANLQGMLEDVSIYDRALSSKEVKSHFESGGAKPIDADSIRDVQPEDPKPTAPDQALNTLRVRKGYTVELVAAEPLTKDPVAIDWGPDGKLWVAEMADYPLGLDGKGKPGGRIRFLEDSNQDGKYDKSTLFAEGLSFPTGVMAWGKGVLVTAAPQILYLEDQDGDGKADARKVLYSGFLEGNQQLRVNGLRWGLDNWIYCASGSHHAGYGKDSRITSHVKNKKYQIGSRDFRIRPSTGEIDPQSGPSQYGRTRDDWGHWFGVQNSHPLWHYVLADHHIRRNPHFAPPDPRRQVVTPTNPKVFPASKPQKRFHSFNQSGRFTSACSPMIYRDNYLFDRGNEQHAFTCEPFHNLVQHNLIYHDGVSFGFRRDPEERAIDFFASTDRWCRPVMARTGPEGAIWIVDMYRYMIEHPQWLPANGKNELRPWYRTGENRGRIYRIVRKGKEPRQVPRLDRATNDELVDALLSPNGWQRDLAQRLLIARNAVSSIARLNSMLSGAKQPLTRLHALSTLEGLNALSTEMLEIALDDRHAGVRRHAVRIASRITVDSKKFISLVQDSDPKVRLQVATTLGQYNTRESNTALARLIIDSKDPHLVAAAMSSLNARNVSDVLKQLVGFPNGLDNSNTRLVIRQSVSMGDETSLREVIDLIDSPETQISEQTRYELLAIVLDTIQLAKTNSESQNPVGDQIADLIQKARLAIESPESSDKIRASAIQLLGRESSRRVDDYRTLRKLLVPQSSVLVQQSIVKTLAGRADDEVAEIVLENWRSHAPALRTQILDLLLTRSNWSALLIQKLSSGEVSLSELDAATRRRLLQMGRNKPEWQKVLAVRGNLNRAKVLDDFQKSTKLPGNLERGSVLFRKLCLNCHKLKDEGFEVGPQLASITNKSKEALLVAILDPNAAVDAKYLTYMIATVDGKNYSGRLETETGSSITLLAAEGKKTTVLRQEIENLKTTNQSVMPEGLEKDLTLQDLADLIHFVREAFK